METPLARPTSSDSAYADGSDAKTMINMRAKSAAMNAMRRPEDMIPLSIEVFLLYGNSASAGTGLVS